MGKTIIAHHTAGRHHHGYALWLNNADSLENEDIPPGMQVDHIKIGGLFIERLPQLPRHLAGLVPVSSEIMNGYAVDAGRNRIGCLLIIPHRKNGNLGVLLYECIAKRRHGKHRSAKSNVWQVIWSYM